MKIHKDVIQSGWVIAFSLLTAAALVSTAHATVAEDRRDAEIQEYLRRFQENPRQVMNQHLEKRDADGNPVLRTETLFPPEMISDRSFVKIRDRLRNKVCTESPGEHGCIRSSSDREGDREGDSEGPLAGIWGNDRAEDLVDSGRLVRSLRQMESRNLMSATLPAQPWSDDYWPFYSGSIGARYADDNFPDDEDWGLNRNYILSRPAYSSTRAEFVDLLSPAEKYDLLVGDSNWTLTEAAWGLGSAYYRGGNSVAEWMGICEGWAPAAYMLPRPAGKITLTAADGYTKINFYPSDIKALASILWAYGEKSIRFVGGRCEDSNPATDWNGRVISTTCFDTNPGTWHLAVVNQVGVSRRSFVLDSTYDYEVWNQPMVGYKYTYFNPQTRIPTARLEDATIPIYQFTGDRFQGYRSSSASHVVGVAMDVKYTLETDPEHTVYDSAKDDEVRIVRYHYDLELDSAGNIIGGEWYTNLHPDFLWTPPPGEEAYSVGDGQLSSSWSGRGPVPWDWRNAARVASSYRTPLAAVVDRLISLSSAVAPPAPQPSPAPAPSPSPSRSPAPGFPHEVTP